MSSISDPVYVDTDENSKDKSTIEEVLEESCSSKLSKNQEWKFVESKNEIYSNFLVEYVNGQKNDLRKCIKCRSIISSCNYGTSAMRTHLKSCKDRTDQDLQQTKLSFSKKSDPVVGVADVSRLVYEDNVPIMFS